MSQKKFVYVANWKMKMSFDKALAFCTDNKNELIQLTKSNNRIILCPEYPALYPMVKTLLNTNVQIGAQNCSQFNTGAYTGQVSAQTLQQVGCSYCIVGHSECRSNGESNTAVACKVIRVLKHTMQPIICVGENKQEYENKKTKMVIEQQLTPVIEYIQNAEFQNKDLYFAYEPVWSIGTGLIASPEYLATIFAWIRSLLSEKLPTAQIAYLYGGSVNADNITQFKEISEIDGFLIGGASLDFQKLQKIVLL